MRFLGRFKERTVRQKGGGGDQRLDPGFHKCDGEASPMPLSVNQDSLWSRIVMPWIVPGNRSCAAGRHRGQGSEETRYIWLKNPDNLTDKQLTANTVVGG